MIDLENNLAKKYVAFLDVLGFKELIFGKKVNLIEIYFNTVTDVLYGIGRDKSLIDSLIVSDSVILIAEYNTDGFLQLAKAVQTIQARLALHNIWFRGSITFGDVYYNKTANLVVGEGLVKAYLLEQKALFPRVMVDPQIITKISTDRKSFFEQINPKWINENDFDLIFHHHVSYDWDKYIPEDLFFVDYGQKLISLALREGIVDEIYNTLNRNLYGSVTTYEKYMWLKNYLITVSHMMCSMYSRLKQRNNSQENSNNYELVHDFNYRLRNL